MKNYEESVEINPNSYWSYIPNYCYRTLIIDGSGSGETNGLLNVIKLQQPNIDKIYLYVNDPFESKYPLFINGREKERKKKLETEKRLLIIHKYLMMSMKMQKTIIYERKESVSSVSQFISDNLLRFKNNLL